METTQTQMMQQQQVAPLIKQITKAPTPAAAMVRKPMTALRTTAAVMTVQIHQTDLQTVAATTILRTSLMMLRILRAIVIMPKTKRMTNLQTPAIAMMTLINPTAILQIVTVLILQAVLMTDLRVAAVTIALVNLTIMFQIVTLMIVRARRMTVTTAIIS